MSIEQFEISLGSRIAQVPTRQNLKAMQYQEAKRAALEASKVKAELETSEPIIQEVIDSIIELKDDQVTEEELHAEYNSEEFAKLTPEVLPAQDSEDTVTVDIVDTVEDAIDDAIDEPENTSEDVVDEPEDTIEDASDEPELNNKIYIEEMIDISASDEDIVLVHESTVLELDDDNFEIQEIQEENK